MAIGSATHCNIKPSQTAIRTEAIAGRLSGATIPMSCMAVVARRTADSRTAAYPSANRSRSSSDRNAGARLLPHRRAGAHRAGAGAYFKDLTISLCLGVDARAARAAVVWWKPMSSARLTTPRLTVAAAACSALLAIGVPSATAAPDTDGQGYVNSTARCATADAAVAFGSTETSRVAICKTPDGKYEYRGVRVSDGAKLVVPASRSGDGGFVADDDGTAYTVTASSLVVSVGKQVIREEPMVDFHAPQTPKAPTPPPTSTPPTSAPPTTMTSPTTSLPPYPAEVGGSGR